MKMKKILFLIIITEIFIGIIENVGAECPKLYNYVEKTYKVFKDAEDNILEFDIESPKQIVPVYIYIDSPHIHEEVILNLSQKKDGLFFDHVKINLKDKYVPEVYLNAPGIHTLLITTDPKYALEDIYGLCENPSCNKTKHKCAPSDRIITKIKVVSTKRAYGVDFKLYSSENVKISYVEDEYSPFQNESAETYKWKFFALSNNSMLREEDKSQIKTENFPIALVVEGIVYDKDANPLKGADVLLYIAGVEERVIHIATITDENGKFIVYYRPEGKAVYRLPKIGIIDKDRFDAYIYGWSATNKADLTPKKPKCEELPFRGLPVDLTLAIGLIIGTILTLFGVGYLQKITKIFKKESIKEKHEH